MYSSFSICVAPYNQLLLLITITNDNEMMIYVKVMPLADCFDCRADCHNIVKNEILVGNLLSYKFHIASFNLKVVFVVMCWVSTVVYTLGFTQIILIIKVCLISISNQYCIDLVVVIVTNKR